MHLPFHTAILTEVVQVAAHLNHPMHLRIIPATGLINRDSIYRVLYNKSPEKSFRDFLWIINFNDIPSNKSQNHSMIIFDLCIELFDAVYDIMHENQISSKLNVF